jgi:hypothetical protein
MVFKTTDDDRAVYLLEVDALIHDLAAVQSLHPSVLEIARREAAEKYAA